jgi:hypothetical protein
LGVAEIGDARRHARLIALGLGAVLTFLVGAV